MLVSGTGLSGVYNIMDHYEHEQKRGVEYVSTMHKAMNGVENFPYYSPTQILREFSQDKLSRWDKHSTTMMFMKSIASGINSLSIYFSLCQSAYICFAPWDQWHYRSCCIFHKALWAPHLAVHKSVALPAAKSWPHWDCHRPHGVRQALLPCHIQLYQTGVQKTFGHLLTISSDQKKHPLTTFIYWLWHTYFVYSICSNTSKWILFSFDI